MTLDDAKILLPKYADGHLDAGLKHEVDAVLAASPELRTELMRIQEENRLLEEALAPLRPSKSARMKLSDAMVEMHRQAKSMAESMPVRGWRIFRLAFCLAALGVAVWIAETRFPTELQYSHNGVFFVSIASIFGVGFVFVLFGSALARTEAKFFGMLSGNPMAKPSALGVLTMQVFGVLAVVASFVMYFFML